MWHAKYAAHGRATSVTDQQGVLAETRTLHACGKKVEQLLQAADRALTAEQDLVAGYATRSRDAKEGLRAFLEHRAPTYTGE